MDTIKRELGEQKQQVESRLARYRQDCGNSNAATAIAGCTALLEARSDDPDALMNRGNAYFSQEQFESAISDYSAVLEQSRDPAVLRRRAEAYAKLGNDELSQRDTRLAEMLESRASGARGPAGPRPQDSPVARPAGRPGTGG
jgi:tetratricopeptide (TPR) repeat protein